VSAAFLVSNSRQTAQACPSGSACGRDILLGRSDGGRTLLARIQWASRQNCKRRQEIRLPIHTKRGLNDVATHSGNRSI
jgi:hypothetical protein